MNIIIFPHQLFPINYYKDLNIKNIYFCHHKYFYNPKFNKKKLLLHLLSSNDYISLLKKNKFIVKEINNLNLPKNQEYHIFNPIEFQLLKELKKFKNVVYYDTPMFILPQSKLKSFYSNSQIAFYTKMRKEYNILPNHKKSYDKDNRASLPKNMLNKIPNIPNLKINYNKEANYINKTYKSAIGNTDNFNYPINRKQALLFLNDFIKNRLKYFGKYQDAIVLEYNTMFHSILSPSINIGLITPLEVINAVLKTKVAINNKEGFVRQILGWREFMRLQYCINRKDIIKSNFFNAKKKLNKTWYNGTTPIEPLNKIRVKGIDTGYLHHIERLMIVANIMTLEGISPKEMNKWFMEFSVDSYEWVMIPNVYGMASYAYTKLSTKPYVSTSNYYVNMTIQTDGKKPKRIEYWDKLFWSFIKKHKNKINKINRMKQFIYMLDKK